MVGTSISCLYVMLQCKIIVDLYDTIDDAGDSFTRHAGHSFSTKDRDNDVYGGHCAQQFKGAWWYSNCHGANLNGLYLGGLHTSYADGIEWSTWYNYYYSLKKVDMKLRPNQL